MKKKLLFKKEHISKLNQFSLTGGGMSGPTTTGDSGYDPSDNTEATWHNCSHTLQPTCVACISVHHSMCIVGVTAC